MEAQCAFCELELYISTVFREIYGCKGNWICCMQYRLPRAALLHSYKWTRDQRALKVAYNLFCLIFASFRLVVRSENVP
jgi:hypothetical protein